MALPASDDFNRADNTTLGTNWTTVFGNSAPAILSNQCVPVSTGIFSVAVWNADTFGNDQYAQATVIAAVTSSTRQTGVVVRGDVTGSATTYYRASVFGPLGASAIVRITKVVAGSPTTLANTSPYTVNANDIVKITAQSTTLQMYINGVAVFGTPPTDSAIASGAAGVQVVAGSGNPQTDAILDNWSADNIVSGVKTRSRTLAAIGTRAGSRQVQAV